METETFLLSARRFARCGALAILIGLLAGAVGGAFGAVLRWVNALRGEYPWLLYLLPAAGLVIVFLYRHSGLTADPGTNAMLAAAQDQGEDPSPQPLRLRQVPLIFLATALTHLTGGSAGREGAALQLGGGLAGGIGRLFRLRQEEMPLLIVCGMAGGFSALFGTPMTASLFALEVATVGVLHAKGLLYALLSAFSSFLVARLFGAEAEAFSLGQMPPLDFAAAIRVVVLGAVIALLAAVFCRVMHTSHRLFARFLPNPYLRVLVGGAAVVGLTLLIGSQTYNGAGTHLISAATQGNAQVRDFALKLLFTALTLGAGYKGGEIVPTLAVGATFGCVFGPLLGLEGGFAAALGMTALFAGCTNCPLAALLLSYELFGGAGLPFFLLTIATAALLSGKDSLYSAQRHLQPKMPG